MTIRAVFFDLGGTLLIMRRDEVFRKVLLEQGLDVDLERIHRAYLRVEISWLDKYSKKELTPEQTTEAYRDLDANVFQALFPDSPVAQAYSVSKIIQTTWPEVAKSVPLELYPDTIPTLTRLKEDRYVLALVSNAPPDTKDAVESLGLSGYLDPVVISGLVGYSKPNPEIFNIALRLAKVLPEQTVHIGDVYESDVVGARSAGIQGILLDRDGSQVSMDSPRIGGLEEVYRFLR